MTSPSKPAFPRAIPLHPTSGRQMEQSQVGMTLREHYAGLALQGLLAAGTPLGDAAPLARDQADALIAALNMRPAV